ncbi:hypothetical protein TNIN_347561 [Trichonephila inaurata madagascariensis]|uniref:Uncharacterized protein n=1 Tax=Trichonephila inaurata madagascariensis TaxID=2747483 RepID=A0A8X6YM01_9ARAC|nr:hypothetical protein TNIN_347561 [Trichonephila inaurata madagascariensis]
MKTKNLPQETTTPIQKERHSPTNKFQNSRKYHNFRMGTKEEFLRSSSVSHPLKARRRNTAKLITVIFLGNRLGCLQGRTKRLITRALYLEENTVISELAMRVRR